MCASSFSLWHLIDFQIFSDRTPVLQQTKISVLYTRRNRRRKRRRRRGRRREPSAGGPRLVISHRAPVMHVVASETVANAPAPAHLLTILAVD
uniref:Uncharacterized protein n=1 Tax=Plectus sambesii TaxID=2011161 RepID=A0A914V7H3_9BILA